MGCGTSTVDSTNQPPQKAEPEEQEAEPEVQEAEPEDQEEEEIEEEEPQHRHRHMRRRAPAQKGGKQQRGGKNPQQPASLTPNPPPKTPEQLAEDETQKQDQGQRGTPPANEKGYKRRIRQNLRNSTAGEDIDMLEKNMDTFQRNKLEDGGDYTDAEDRLDYLHCRKDIRDACMRRHPKVLEDSIQRTEQSPYKAQLQQYLDRARFLLKNNEDQKMFKHKVLSPQEQATVSEVRSYHHPPPGCQNVMIAVYMICGYDEKHLTDWPTITGLMGRYGNHSLPREMHEAEGKPVDQDVALTARNYLGTHTREEIREGSNGATAFYDWACGMVGLHNPDSGNKGQQGNQPPGQQKNKPNTPKSQSEPSRAGTRDPVKDKKQQKEQENKAKQQQPTPQSQQQKQANQQANKTVKDATKTTTNTQQATTVGTKSTKQG